MKKILLQLFSVFVFVLLLTTVSAKVAFALPTGGTVTQVGNDYIHTFSSSGTFTSDISVDAQVLVVAGGGGGAAFYHGGGGGGGGVLYNAAFSITAQAYSVTVGAGGAGGSGSGGTGTNGSNSVFSSLTAIGGGHGANNGGAATVGGAGGGGSYYSTAGAAGTSGQGYAGGTASQAGSCYGAGGGGGAGAVGGGGSGSNGGAGGAGITNTISGGSVYYGGGGGGSVDGSACIGGGAGGAGGGGAGSNANGGNGTANTGGGGGAGERDGSTGGNGGSGIVIIRYTPPAPTSTSTPTPTATPTPTPTPSSCHPDLTGNHTITTDCSFSGITDGNSPGRIVDGVDAGTGSTNTAVMTVQSGILTINANETVAAGSFVLTGGSIALADGGIMKPGTPLWVVDGDGDGYANEIKVYSQITQPTNGRRRGVMSNLAAADCDDTAYSATNSCGKRREIALTYSGTTLTNYDVVFTVDTASSIASGFMTADCGDIRMKDADGETLLSYWIEGGCDTATTQIWTRVPSIPDGGKTIYMDYNGSTAANGFEAWAGSFTLMNTASCPAGWTQNADFDNTFPYGSDTYGATGGASSHSHAAVSCTTSTNTLGGGRTGGGYACSPSHAHGNANATIGGATNILPPYLDVVMCKKADLIIPASFIALFDTTVPSGWTRFSALDTYFPRGATSYGVSSETVSHAHTKTGGTTNNNSGSGGCQAGTCEGDYSLTHYHAVSSGTTALSSHIPPYLDMIFGQTNAQAAPPAGLIALTDVLPPLGWTRFSALDNKFPRGASVYGGTGGVATHTHSVTLSTGGPSSTRCGLSGSQAGGKYNHSHSCTATTDAQSNLPPYAMAIFAKRNTPLPIASVGPEQ